MRNEAPSAPANPKLFLTYKGRRQWLLLLQEWWSYLEVVITNVGSIIVCFVAILPAKAKLRPTHPSWRQWLLLTNAARLTKVGANGCTECSSPSLCMQCNILPHGNHNLLLGKEEKCIGAFVRIWRQLNVIAWLYFCRHFERRAQQA